jgi:hypothetical protein
MARRLSTGMRNALLGVGPMVNALTISFDAVTKEVRDSANGFGAFVAGDVVRVTGSTLNDGIYIATAAGAGTITVAGTLVDEIAGSTVKVKAHRTGSLRDILKDGVIRLYSGAQPASADDAETGTLLVELTQSSLAFVAGAVANGLELGEAVAGVISKEFGEVWSGINQNGGTAGWGRWYANTLDTGASTTARRIDFACGVSGAELNMTSTSLTALATTTIDTVAITQPT